MGTMIVSGAHVIAAATAAWTKRALDTEEANTITGAVFDGANDEIDLPAGTYDVDGYHMCWKGDSVHVRLWDITGAAVLLYGGAGFSENGGNFASVTLPLKGRFTLAGASSLRLEYFLSASGDLGNGAPSGSTRAVYLRLTEVA